MDEHNEAIARVRAHGETLKRGAPHQTELGADLVIVADVAVMATRPQAPAPDVSALRQKIDELNTYNTTLASSAKALQDELDETKGAIDELETKFTEALEENSRLSNAVAEAATENVRLREASQIDPSTGLLKGLHPLATFAGVGTGGDAPTPDPSQKQKRKKD